MRVAVERVATARSYQQHTQPDDRPSGARDRFRDFCFDRAQPVLPQAFRATRLIVARIGRKDLVALNAVILHGGCPAGTLAEMNVVTIVSPVFVCRRDQRPASRDNARWNSFALTLMYSTTRPYKSAVGT